MGRSEIKGEEFDKVFSAVIISNFVSAKNIPIFIVSSLSKYEACDYCNIQFLCRGFSEYDLGATALVAYSAQGGAAVFGLEGIFLQTHTRRQER